MAPKRKKGGSASSSIAASLRATSAGLAKIALNCRTGAHVLTSAHTNDMSAASELVRAMDEVERLKRQVRDVRVTTAATRKLQDPNWAQRLNEDGQPRSEDDLHAEMAALQERYFVGASEEMWDAALYKRIQQNQELVSMVFGRAAGQQGGGGLGVDAEVKAHVLHAGEGASQLAQLVEAWKEATKELVDLRNESMTLKVRARRLFAELKLRERDSSLGGRPSDTEDLRNLERRVKQQKGRNEIVRNVFLHLILASGVNWAQDDVLRAVVLGEVVPPPEEDEDASSSE